MLDLRSLSFDLGKGQKELGEIIGVAQSQVSAMMNGKREIRLEHIARLYERFGKEVVDSYMRQDPPVVPCTTTATFYPAREVENIRDEVEAENVAEVRTIVERFLASLERRDKQIDELIAQHKEMLEIIRSMSQK